MYVKYNSSRKIYLIFIIERIRIDKMKEEVLSAISSHCYCVVSSIKMNIFIFDDSSKFFIYIFPLNNSNFVI